MKYSEDYTNGWAKGCQFAVKTMIFCKLATLTSLAVATGSVLIAKAIKDESNNLKGEIRNGSITVSRKLERVENTED